MFDRLISSTAILVAVGLAVSSASAQVAIEPNDAAASTAGLLAKAQRTGGLTRVIVQFAEPATALGIDQGSAAYTSALRASQQAIISDVFGQTLSGQGASDRALTLMDVTPLFAVNVTDAELARLARDPRVVSIQEDVADRPSLLQSLGIIRMTGTGGAYSLNATGTGRAVAVLDTGANKNNEFLKNKIISEACYNTNSAAQGSTSRCPGGAASSTAANSGLDCAATISGCGHGTHVSGIAAGKNTGFSAGEPKNGVASQAGIVIVNVFSRFGKASGNCGSGATQDCLLSFTSDQIKGLERVFALRAGVANRKIDSVNMSLGGGFFTTFCNSDSRKLIIDKLRNAGIATVIASGNDGFTDAVAAPACILTAITVGSSTKTKSGNPERMSSFSNQGPQVDTLAPGGDFNYPTPSGADEPKNRILSSEFGGYAFLAGTSMAAPHVAGAIAAVRSRTACRTKTVEQIEKALHNTGPQITDHRTAPGLTERRLNVVALMKKLGCA